MKISSLLISTELYNALETHPDINVKVLAKRAMLTLVTAIIISALADFLREVVGV